MSGKKLWFSVAGATLGGLWLWQQQKQRGDAQPSLTADHLISRPEVDAHLVQTANGRYDLRWDADRNPASVYVGRSPEPDPTADILLLHTAKTPSRLTLPPDLQRPYLHLFPHHGAPLTVAERVLSLPGSINLRDIGGYTTQDGQTTRWGRLYRSGALNQLTPDAWSRLDGLNVRLICDLRSSEERQKAPNYHPRSLREDWHNPVHEAGGGRMQWFRRLLREKDQVEALWQEIYNGRLVDRGAPAYARFLTRLAVEDNLPMLVHCTAGKDRTGIAIALLLLLLGVPRQVVLDDYTLSNAAYPAIRAAIARDTRRLALFGIRAHNLFPILTARADVLETALNHIETTYGSVEAYLVDHGGLDPDIIPQLRQLLLIQRDPAEHGAYPSPR